MSDSDATRWFGIRTVYLFGKKKDGTNVFEERVVAFSGSSEAEAFRKAERESDRYAASNGIGIGKMKCHPDMVAYFQDGENLIDGYEVWSELFESSEDLESFYTSRYVRYAYEPDP